MAALPYSERMAPASWPLFCRSCARVTADSAGTATASIRAATARATLISTSVMPRSGCARIPMLLPRRGGPGGVAAVHGDVVPAPLRLVGTERIDVVALAGAEVGVVLAPGVLAELAHVLGEQLLERVRPLPGIDVVEIDAVRQRLQIELRGLHLRVFERLEHVVADRAGDQPEDDQHDHDLDQRHAAGSGLAGLSQMSCEHGSPLLGNECVELHDRHEV